jgi:pterin-4a-carbinolamine dehydratase
MDGKNLPKISDSLAHHPSIHKKEGSVRLAQRFLKREGQHGIQTLGNV